MSRARPQTYRNAARIRLANSNSYEFEEFEVFNTESEKTHVAFAASPLPLTPHSRTVWWEGADTGAGCETAG